MFLSCCSACVSSFIVFKHRPRIVLLWGKPLRVINDRNSGACGVSGTKNLYLSTGVLRFVDVLSCFCGWLGKKSLLPDVMSRRLSIDSNSIVSVNACFILSIAPLACSSSCKTAPQVKIMATYPKVRVFLRNEFVRNRQI